MAFATALTAIAIGSAVAGTALQIKGNAIQAKASQAAEEDRKRQMNLEAERARRQSIREAIVARSLAVSNATSQGAQDSSGLAGGLAQVTGTEGRNIQGINQNQEIGSDIFDQNKLIAQGQGISSLGSSLSGFGSQINQFQGPISRVGNYLTNQQGY